MRILLFISAALSVANAMSTTPYTPTGPIDNAGMPGRTAAVHPAGGWNSLVTRNQMTGERSSGATASQADTNPMAQMLSMLSLGGSGTGGGFGGSGNVGGLGSLFGGGHADMDPMSQMFPSMFNLGGSGTGGGSGGSSTLGGLGSLFGGGGNSLQNMALLGTGTDQLLNLAGMDCMMNSAAPSTAMDPACMMLMMQQMTTGI